jgi:hypothetical protein
VLDILDGRDGTDRGSVEQSQLSARNDLNAIRAWLSNYADTKTTFDNYRKEAERLLLWAVVQFGKPQSSLTHEDLLLFKAFLVDPQTVIRWVSANGGNYPCGDERWRPFSGPMSPASQRQALIILNAMLWQTKYSASPSQSVSVAHASFSVGSSPVLPRGPTQRTASARTNSSAHCSTSNTRVFRIGLLPCTSSIFERSVCITKAPWLSAPLKFPAVLVSHPNSRNGVSSSITAASARLQPS